MAITNNLRKQVDLPVWEWLRFAPIPTAAAYCTCTSETGLNRYIYYLGATFWRYDTISDAWQQLATPNTAIVTNASMRFAAYNGMRTRALAGGTNTITLAALNGSVLVGNKIKIVGGTGMGQERTINSVSDSVIADHGVLTSAAVTVITDTTKKWKINQWVGYECRLVFDAGTSQVRKILYNDATNLYFSDTNYQAIDHWNNTGFSAITPYAAPVITAGVQTHYVIESSILTVDTNWTTQPDITSRVAIFTGGIWLMSSAVAAPFFTLQYYCIARDTWYTKTATATLLAAAATDLSIEKLIESIGSFDNATASSGGPSTITCSTENWPIDRYVNYQVRITSGTGIGQKQRIIANNATTLTTVRPWTVQPDATSVFSIIGDSDKMFAVVGGSAALLQYHLEADLWAFSDIHDTGIARNMSATFGAYEPVGLTSIVRNTGGILTVASSPSAGGTNYVVGDILTVSGGGGTNGKVRVTSVSPGGIVSGIELFRSGLTYTPGSALTTSGGTGTSCTVQILTVGPVGYVTTAMNHFFRIGDSVTISGCSTDATWNNSFTIIGGDAITTFDVSAPSSTASPTVTASQGASLLVDSSKNWTNGELIGKILQKSLVGVAGTTEAHRITGNTATSITTNIAFTAAPVNGTGRYLICDPQALGRDEQFRVPTMNGRGYATGGSLTTLVDSSKSWNGNQWANYRIRIISGTGVNSEFAITSNTNNTLTYASQSFTPDSTTKYLIMDTFGQITTYTSTTVFADATKNWATNQWAGKRVRINSGTGQSSETTITSNTNNTLTLTTAIIASGVDANYTILASPVKGVGQQLIWIWGGTGVNGLANLGRYLWCPIGGNTTRFERYDLTTGLWDIGLYLQPLTELLSTGTMYCYDGINRIYFTTNSTGRIFSLDVTNFQVSPAGMTPFAHGTALLGNRMEIFDTADGLSYLWIMRQTGQEVWRTLLF